MLALMAKKIKIFKKYNKSLNIENIIINFEINYTNTFNFY